MACCRRYVETSPSLFFLLFLFCLVLHLGKSQLPPNQRDAMVDLSKFVQNSTWKTKENPCLWEGVHCSSNDSSITSLSLHGFSISTPDVMSAICQIESLQALDLSNNHLTSIPDGFIHGCGGINGLKQLNFSRNWLTGRLPAFHGFSGLQVLDLSHNSLNGIISLQLDGLVELKCLNLSNNKFTGPLPTHLGKSMVLEQLELSQNSFQGEIPEDIFVKYNNLTVVDLSQNPLSGSIPDRIGESSKLEVLVLSSNQLEGEIPKTLLNIKTLTRFAANQNKLNGSIPSQTTRILQSLDLSFNHLGGSIPPDLLSRQKLHTVDLTSNVLEGSIPANMSPSLVRLRLGSNSLSGSIPSAAFENLKDLASLELDSNKLTGSIPPQLGSCRNLTLLNLANNKLTGALPLQLGNLHHLHVMKLQSNKLQGRIPDEIANLKNLLILNISLNSLSSKIPLVLNLHNLTNLCLQGNNLTGSIPESISSLNSLLELQLGHNQLTGGIPQMPNSLQIALNLSDNHFGGPIPQDFSRLTSLEVLDLSGNNFTGEIPRSLTGLVTLTELILSNNQLSGEIPKFDDRVIVNTTGNMALFKNSSSAPPSAASPKKGRSVLLAVTIAVAAAVLTVGVIASIALAILQRFHQVNNMNVHSGEGFSSQQILQSNLLTANTIHLSNINLLKGIEAVCHPSNVMQKTRFSTYYKANMPSGMAYFVKRLNWSEKIFQVGGHDKFREEMQLLGKLSNSNVMTPLAYVLAVDSAYVFYEFTEMGTLYDVLHGDSRKALDWSTRYSIALGVAQGMSFLHGYPSGPFLLLDLSSKTILLKTIKEPQIGDIELHKVIDPSKGSSSLSTVAGTAGYISPEYAYTMRVTTAGNVYSFGVILLELLTGKPAVSEGTELTKWVISNSTQHRSHNNILDVSLSRSSVAIRSQMMAVLEIALGCISGSPEARPKMKSVLQKLVNARL